MYTGIVFHFVIGTGMYNIITLEVLNQDAHKFTTKSKILDLHFAMDI